MIALTSLFRKAFAFGIGAFLWGGPRLAAAEPVKSSLAFHFAGWSLGKSGPSEWAPQRTFYPEPAFLTMTEVGDQNFGVLELDMLVRFLTHWTYGAATDSTDRSGLDHAYLTVNKGYFLLNEGKGGSFDWGLGMDLDWRRAGLNPREGYPATRSYSVVGAGLVTRMKMDAGGHFLLSPAIAYDAYAWPHRSGSWITGHGIRADCDIWISAWPGPYKLTLQPFWHWHSWSGIDQGRPFRDVETRTFGVKFGFGVRPQPFVPSY
jgi:hypothetical protein